MISFIVIGQNEGWKLNECLDSIIKTIEHNKLNSYEILYVDSKSTDDSVQNAKKYNNVKVILLQEDCNAAIARNVGVKESCGDILFFIDGDMEIVPDKLSVIYNEISGISFPFISGNYHNYDYDNSWNFLKKKNSAYNSDSDFFTFTTGGLFLIERHLWNEVYGMNNRFKKSQDIDFALRLAKKGYLLLRRKDIFAIHHMIPYMDKDRKWRLFFDNLYARSFLYRHNILNKYAWKRFLRNDTSVCILLTSFLAIVNSKALLLTLPSYLFFVLIKTLRKKGNYFSNFIYFILRDLLVLFGFFFFFPQKRKESYEVVKYPTKY